MNIDNRITKHQTSDLHLPCTLKSNFFFDGKILPEPTQVAGTAHRIYFLLVSCLPQLALKEALHHCNGKN